MSSPHCVHDAGRIMAEPRRHPGARRVRRHVRGHSSRRISCGHLIDGAAACRERPLVIRSSAHSELRWHNTHAHKGRACSPGGLAATAHLIYLYHRSFETDNHLPVVVFLFGKRTRNGGGKLLLRASASAPSRGTTTATTVSFGDSC